MLKELRCTHFGPIDHLRFQPDPRWVALTGETGSGKSLVIEALQCVAGARVQARWLPHQNDWAEVEAVLVPPAHPEVFRVLHQVGIEPDDGVIVVQRRLDREGRSRVWIQNRRTTLKRLRQLMTVFFDICDQWGFTRLLSPQTQRQWLDAFGGYHESLRALRQAVQPLRRLQKALRGSEDADWLRQSLERMRQEWKELDAAQLEPDEEPELERRFRLQSRAMHYRELTDRLMADLAEGDHSFMDRLSAWRRDLEDLADIDPVYRDHLAQLEGWQSAVQALVYDLLRTRDQLEWDPDEWHKLETRMALIQDLKRKYRMTYPELLAHRDRLAREIADLDTRLAERALLLEQAHQAYGTYLEAVYTLHDLRVDAAHRLGYQVTETLRQLGIPDARFEVRVTLETPPDRWSPSTPVREGGHDTVSFWFSADGDRPLLPLHQVASGGELARILLALKATVGVTEWPRTVVFDEIDMGVGGATLEAVGDLLARIAEHDQVITVTHWPQLAARADEQWRLERESGSGLTLKRLNARERIREIARMIGEPDAPTARAHARVLVQNARRQQAVVGS